MSQAAKGRPDVGDSGHPQAHTRSYQACTSCRNRKVKCDMGPVDNPHGPPCQRCRREQKGCTISATRRKHKSDGLDEDEIDTSSATGSNATPTWVSRSTGRTFPMKRSSSALEPDEEDREQSADAAEAILQRSDTVGGHAGLALLAEAARQKTSIGDPAAVLAVRSWAKFKFVMAGWFSASEAIGYISYFYKYLAPMTPVVIADYRHPSTHETLLIDEPVLAMTMLTIASRYMALKGHGSVSRSHAIHDRLWREITNILVTILFKIPRPKPCGMGKSILDPRYVPRQGLHALGTIESLLLLMEWHPRALHFPAETDSGGTYCISGTTLDSSLSPSSDDSNNMQDWMDIIQRSDNLSWTFATLAISLGTENQLFTWADPDMAHYLSLSREFQTENFRRAQCIRRLLYIFVTQLSARLNVPALRTDNWDKHLFSQIFLQRAQSTLNDQTTDTNQNVDLNFRQELTLWFWCRLAHLTDKVKAALYPTPEYAKQLIDRNIHREVMQQFEPALSEWSKDLANCSHVTTDMRRILDIEFAHLRVYINQPALAAVVQRCKITALTPDTTRVPMPEFYSDKPVAIPAHVLQAHIGDERKFIDDIVDAAQALLCTANELRPKHVAAKDSRIRCAPARTFIRIFTATTMLLKTFVCGATEDVMKTSLQVFMSVTHALEAYPVDDLHIGAHVAHSLGVLHEKIRAKMIRVAALARKNPAANQLDHRFPSQPSQTVRSKKTRADGDLSLKAMLNNLSQGPAFDPNMQAIASYPLQRSVSAASYINSATTDSGFGPYSYPPRPTLTRQGTNHSVPDPQDVSRANVLYGIETTTGYNPNNPSMSIMPPPSINSAIEQAIEDYPDTFGDSLNAALSGNPGGVEDWLALPLDPLLSFDMDIDQVDMLDMFMFEN